MQTQEAFVLDCSVTMAWRFADRSLPKATRLRPASRGRHTDARMVSEHCFPGPCTGAHL